MPEEAHHPAILIHAEVARKLRDGHGKRKLHYHEPQVLVVIPLRVLPG